MEPESPQKKEKTRIGIGTVILLSAICPLILFCVDFVIHPLKYFESHNHHDACVNNLKQIGLILNMYANEHEEALPPIDDTKDNFIFDGNILIPEYLSDRGVVVCPGDADYNPETNFRLLSVERHPASSVGDSHPDCLTDMSYCYLGWLVTSDEEAEAFFEAYDKLSPEDYDKDIIVADGRGNDGGKVIHRLRIGADQFLPENGADPESPEFVTPIAWDIPNPDPAESNHRPGEAIDGHYRDGEGPGGVGGNVLYLDGHVEFIKFGERFPITETVARLLEERPRERIPGCDE